VAIVVLGLMLSRSLGKTEDPPVLDASDCAAGLEDEGACCAGDSGSWSVRIRVTGSRRGSALFDLEEVAGSDL